MALVIFKNQEKQYFDWIGRHREGYVLNTTRNPSPSYMVLHRATCATVERYLGKAKQGAFTERQFIKVCSTSPSALRRWARANGAADFSAQCSHCAGKSPVVLDDPLEKYHGDLEAAVVESLADPKGRHDRLSKASTKPKTTTVKTTVFVRNPDVIAEVLYRAAGICAACKEAAPFTRASNGKPYLEVHHKVPLADEGEDTVENAEALCPNCHRKFHFGIVAVDA